MLQGHMSSHEHVSKYVPFRFQAMPPPSGAGGWGSSAILRPRTLRSQAGTAGAGSLWAPAPDRCVSRPRSVLDVADLVLDLAPVLLVLALVLAALVPGDLAFRFLRLALQLVTVHDPSLRRCL